MPHAIAFFDVKPYDRDSFERENPRFGFELRYFPVKLSKETVSLAAGADAVCAFVNDDISAEVIDALVSMGVRLIALRCAGFNNVALERAFGRIHVVRVPAYSPYAVAEHAAALLLTLDRKTNKAYFRTRDGNFTLNGLLGFDLHGKTIGIVGTGKIGRVAAGIFRGFGMNVLLSDPYPDEAWAASIGASYVALESLYLAADVISLHCPLTPESRHMIDADSISRMKDGVVLINTSRGGLVDSKALIDALKTGKVGGAGLDVYEEEDQYFFEDFSGSVIEDDALARLLSFPNVLLTAHQAFFTEEALKAIAMTTLGNVKAYLDSGELPNEVCYKCASGECLRKKTGKCF
jgi:D-lactate dehydrogenase